MTVVSHGGVRNGSAVVSTLDFYDDALPAGALFDGRHSPHGDTIELVSTRDSSAEFGAVFSSWTLGEIVLTRAVFSGARMRPWRHRPRSHPDHRCLVLARTTADDGATREDLGFRPPMLPFEGRARACEIVTLHLPRDWRPAEEQHADGAGSVRVNDTLAPLLIGYIDGLVRLLPDVPPEHAAGLEAPTRALIAACISPSPAGVEPARPVLGSVLVDRARSVVRLNMASPDFGPEGLARLLAMSRSKLYRLFEQSGGVAHFINRERLREAHKRLSSQTETLSIHAIGNEVGFVDHSTFSRAFRREFGYSPTEARERSLVLSFADALDGPVQG